MLKHSPVKLQKGDKKTFHRAKALSILSGNPFSREAAIGHSDRQVPGKRMLMFLLIFAGSWISPAQRSQINFSFNDLGIFVTLVLIKLSYHGIP
ncbi:hypothetical protein FD723_40480 (plasmid) [Nostoc sp. C052]|uniref:hypothetical protein n=1 Tax=Nostoc sp. C052 TaxID=2576902 RepID=UPI0015C32EA0|nr:hypothetical protein [Nostoc sp. C052]QLE46491.1 hypothetical protein FD723_40480 [Nostoc sp. C052]